MTSTFSLALKSLRNRKTTTFLTLFSISLSVCLLLGVQKIRDGARDSFENTISGADLIVGARSGPVQLLLYSVFRIGNPTNNVTWPSYQAIKQRPEIAWTIPLSLGDSHRGYRVVGTDQNYFEHYRYGPQLHLKVAEGKPFSDLFDTVIGSEVAKKLQYKVGDKITLSHGVSTVALQEHADKPFTIVGIIAPTGTPVDRSVHVSLEAIEAIHVDWQDGGPPASGQEVSGEQVRQRDLTPRTVSAFIIGLKSKMAIFTSQRAITDYPEEPMLAILPGVAFQELWGTVAIAEMALKTVAIFVVLVGLVGMVTTLLTSLNERRREMAILRSVGAQPFDIFTLLVGEALLIATSGVVIGLVAVNGLIHLAQSILQEQYGLYIAEIWMDQTQALQCLAVIVAGLLGGLIPAWRAYKNSLIDGLTIKV